MVPLQDNRFTSVERIRICGYSSPDGPYGDNERLAKARSGLFAYYLRNAYGIPRNLVEVSSVAEDWEAGKTFVAGCRAPGDPPLRDFQRA